MYLWCEKCADSHHLAHAQSCAGIFSPLKYSVISSDSVSRQWRTWSDKIWRVVLASLISPYHVTIIISSPELLWSVNIRCPSCVVRRGWSGGAKVLCILHHWGVQLILAYSWARPAILVVGKGRRGIFLFLLFLHFHSCSSFFPIPLFHLLYSLLSLFSLSLGDDTKWPSRVDVSLNPNTINQSCVVRRGASTICFKSLLLPHQSANWLKIW